MTFDERTAEKSQQPGGVKCFGCGKLKKIVTSKNKKNQPLCSRCNNMLRRRFGKKYGDILDNPAATLEALEQAEQDTKDRKKIRKDFFAVLNVLEEIEPNRHQYVWYGCGDYFGDLPEAQPFLTFDRTFLCQTSNARTDEAQPEDKSAKTDDEPQQ